MRSPTLLELYSHSRWADARILAESSALSDEQLNQAFEMGHTSLKGTLAHVYGAQRTWLERMGVKGWDSLPASGSLSNMAKLRDATSQLESLEEQWMKTLSDEDLAKTCAYTNLQGQRFENTVGDVLLHVYNHGIHHRAQASNMLRHLGGKVPRIDYIFMKVDQQAAGNTASTPASIPLLHDYFAYGDWAMQQVLDASAELPAETLDRSFEMGMGTLRKTLVHIHDAESWWPGYWKGISQNTFPAIDATMSISELKKLGARTAQDRNAYISRMKPEDTAREIKVQPVTGTFRSFRIGQTMLQLCGHGTHHRAQVLNMLRHVGATLPRLDYILWTRERGKAAD